MVSPLTQHVHDTRRNYYIYFLSTDASLTPIPGTRVGLGLAPTPRACGGNHAGPAPGALAHGDCSGRTPPSVTAPAPPLSSATVPAPGHGGAGRDPHLSMAARGHERGSHRDRMASSGSVPGHDTTRAARGVGTGSAEAGQAGTEAGRAGHRGQARAGAR